MGQVGVGVSNPPLAVSTHGAKVLFWSDAIMFNRCLDDREVDVTNK